MDSWIGGFKNLQKVHNNGHYAVTGEPTFFSKEANPKAQQVRKQIDEASDMGIPCGVSIGARPITSEMITKDGKQYKKWTDIEVMEGTFTPVQSNRNSYAYVAKSFGLKDKNLEGENMTKEDIKKTLNKLDSPKKVISSLTNTKQYWSSYLDTLSFDFKDHNYNNWLL